MNTLNINKLANNTSEQEFAVSSISDRLERIALEIRKSLFYHPKLGFNYNFKYTNPGQDHRKEEARINSLTDGKIKFKFISHRQLIINIGNDKINLQAAKRFGTINNTNMVDSIKNNPYTKVAKEIAKATKSINIKNNSIKYTEMKETDNTRSTNSMMLTATDIKMITNSVVSLIDNSSIWGQVALTSPEFIAQGIEKASHKLITGSIMNGYIVLQPVGEGHVGIMIPQSTSIDFIRDEIADLIKAQADRINKTYAVEMKKAEVYEIEEETQTKEEVSNTSISGGNLKVEQAIVEPSSSAKETYNKLVAESKEEIDKIVFETEERGEAKQRLTGLLTRKAIFTGCITGKHRGQTLLKSFLNDSNRKMFESAYKLCNELPTRKHTAA